MSDLKTNWSKKELNAYILMYCANANFKETSEEFEMIQSKVNTDSLYAIRKEFNNDNDYQSIQKIQSTIERLGYNASQIDEIIAEIKSLFLADGTFDPIEKVMFSGLRNLLK